MAAISFSISNTPIPRLTPKEVENNLNEWMCKGIETIAKNSFEAQSKGLLDKGIWYPIDYKHALDKKGTPKANERYEWLKKNNGFTKGFLPSKYFTRLGKIENYNSDWRFTVNTDVKPSEAILDIVEKNLGPCILDCGAVCQIVRYYALLKVIGDERFNRLFTEAHGECFNTDYQDTPDQPMRYFVRFTDNAKNIQAGTVGNRPILPGQVVSFNNHSLYKQKHPSGMDSNFNLVVTKDKSGKQCFTGHGVLNKTEKEMKEFLQTQFNNDYDEEAYLSLVPEKELDNERKFQEVNRVFKKEQVSIHQIPGYDIGSPQEFNSELVRDLMEVPLDQLDIKFVKNHPQAKDSLNVINHAINPSQPIELLSFLLSNLKK